MLNSYHNIHYYQGLMRDLREAICARRLAHFAAEFFEKRAQVAPAMA